MAGGSFRTFLEESRVSAKAVFYKFFSKNSSRFPSFYTFREMLPIPYLFFFLSKLLLQVSEKQEICLSKPPELNRYTEAHFQLFWLSEPKIWESIAMRFFISGSSEKQLRLELMFCWWSKWETENNRKKEYKKMLRNKDTWPL